jgi:hypothetical protein
MYDSGGPFRGVAPPGIAAWAAGAIVYFAGNSWSAVGGTIPALVTSVVVYTVAVRLNP